MDIPKSQISPQRFSKKVLSSDEVDVNKRNEDKSSEFFFYISLPSQAFLTFTVQYDVTSYV